MMTDFKLLSLSYGKYIFYLFLVLICKFLRVWQYSLKLQNPFWVNLHFLCQNKEKVYTTRLGIYIWRCEYHNRFIYSFCLLDVMKLNILAWITRNPRNWIKVHLAYITTWWKYNGNNMSTLRWVKLLPWMVARDNRKFAQRYNKEDEIITNKIQKN